MALQADRSILYFMLLNLQLTRFVCCSENVLFNFIPDQNYSSVKCISNILTNYLPCGTLTTFINPNINVNKIIYDSNKENVCNSIIIQTFDVDSYHWFTGTDVYIITAENLLELEVGLMDFTRDSFWNPRARFIIQLNYLNGEDEVREVFQLIIKYNVYNMILIRNLKNDAMIYTYYPFQNNNCGKRFEKIVLGTCETAKNITYFPNNVPSEMENCSIKVVASDDVPNFISKSSNYTVYGKFVPGLDQYLLDTIASREGFFIEYKIFKDDEAFYGVVLPNRTSTGLLNYLDNDRADIAAGGYVLMQNRVELFDYLYGFNYAAYYLFTPSIKGHAWKRLYKEFGQSTWLLIAAALILVITVCQILKRLINDRTSSILNIWGYFLGNANAGMSRNRHFRILIFSWSWFTFFIISFYNTALFSLISVHVRDPPLAISAENLKTLPYEPCISDNSRMFFEFAFNQTLPEGEPIHNCTYTDGALKYVASTKKYYAIEMENSYKLKEYEYLDSEGKPNLDSWRFSSSHVIVMYLDKGFRFRDKFQKYASRMFETGLIENHLNTISLRSFSVLKRYPTTFKNTTIFDLSLHFGILLLGYVLSFLCFLLEIWYHKLNKDTTSKRKAF